MTRISQNQVNFMKINDADVDLHIQLIQDILISENIPLLKETKAIFVQLMGADYFDFILLIAAQKNPNLSPEVEQWISENS